MRNEYIAVASEINELTEILSLIPETNVIERMSFENRLEKANALLKKIKASPKHPEKARLTFRGTPVFGSSGINAEFGAKALGSFIDAVFAIIASFDDTFKYMGQIPKKTHNQFMITSTAIGSFGFELELPVREEKQLELLPVENEAEIAIKKIQDLFKITATGNDDELSELVDEIHPRAVKKVEEFFTYLVTQDAWCGLDFKDNSFKYSDKEQLQYSLERINTKNIKEENVSYTGIIQGFLPHERSFEFINTEKSNDIIKGKLDIQIKETDRINTEFLNKNVKLNLHVIQVGQGRPRYTLESLDNIQLLT